MPEPAVRFLIALFAVPAAVASPLDGIATLTPEAAAPQSDRVRIENGHARHLSAESERLTETSRSVQFRFDGVPGDLTPAWSVEHRAYDIDGEWNGFDLAWSGREDAAGFGLATAGGHRVLLGPDRFEWRQAGPDAGFVTVGWVSPRRRVSIEATGDNDVWQADFRQTPATVYLDIARGERALALEYGDEHRWSLAFRARGLSVELARDSDSWPVLNDAWDGGTASLRHFQLSHHRLTGHYRTASGPIDGVGLALQRWEADAQAIFPYDDSPGAIETSGELETRDIWLDVAHSGWRGRWLLRYAEPEGSGAHYPIYFPGLGERWPEPDIRHAWLAGARLDYGRPLGDRARIELWAQQWWPLHIARSRSEPTADDGNGSGDGGGAGGGGGDGDGGSDAQTAGQSPRHVFGGLQFGVRFRLL